MTKLDATKRVATSVVSFSVGRVISTILHNQVPTQTLTDKVALEVGSMAIGGLVAKHAAEYTNDTIDDIAAWWKTNVTKS